MPDEKLAPVCGLYCGACEHLGEKCRGCGHQEGKPFWTAMMNVEVCPLYDCCVNRKRLEHCGMCDALPCETFQKFHDPALSPEEAQQAVLDRRNDLLKRKEIGTIEWIKLKEI